jgi:hypothetical protein
VGRNVTLTLPSSVREAVNKRVGWKGPAIQRGLERGS